MNINADYNELSTLIADIGSGKNDESIHELSKEIESFWKGGLINTAEFTRLYKQVSACKNRLNRNRFLNYQKLMYDNKM